MNIHQHHPKHEQTLQKHLTTTSTTTSISSNGTVTTTSTKKFLDKPTLVKRLALGLLRSTEEYRPLMQNKSSPPSPTKSFFDDNYDNNRRNQNKTLYDLNKIISHKFGDSCRQSLNSVRADDTKHYEIPSHHKHFMDFDNRRNKLIRETNSASSSPTKLPRLFGSIKRTDSLNAVEENDLRSAAWYQEGLPREISLEVLAQQPPGAFLVRRSASKTGCFALSVRTPPPGPKVAHYLILRTSRGYKIKVIIIYNRPLCHFAHKTFTGLYQRIFNITCINHTSFSYAGNVTGPSIATTSQKHPHEKSKGRRLQQLQRLKKDYIGIEYCK